MFNTSIIQLSKAALKSNFEYLKNYIGENVKISSVVKGNAYGHGIEPYVKLAQECGINHFSVYSADEALRVKTALKKKNDIMIMGFIDNDELEWAINNKIEFYVFDFDRLEKAIEIAKQTKKRALIHIEVETGMNRTGFGSRRLGKVLEIVKKNSDKLEIIGLCTHYAGAESISNYVRIHNQYELFNKIYNKLIKEGVKPRIKHTASSAAAMTYPYMQMDMVRVGILQYGFWPSLETFIDHIAKKKIHEDPLKRILEWKSKVMSTKNVKMGEFIGYGNYFLAERNMKVALIPIGYSHGFSRSLSNTGRVLIRGQRVGIVGTVNMNLIIVDVTSIPGVRKGDSVVIIGKQGKNEITVQSFMQMSNQLNYELLSRLPGNIPRIVTD